MNVLNIKSLLVTAAVAVASLSSAASAHELDRAAGKSVRKATAASYQGAAPALKKRVYLGRAPYICGPSGFGQVSKCFQRASLR